MDNSLEINEPVESSEPVKPGESNEPVKSFEDNESVEIETLELKFYCFNSSVRHLY